MRPAMNLETTMKCCDKCEGTGYADEYCETCERKGWVEDPLDGGTMTCPECDGESETLCEECDGTGQLDDA